MSGKSCPRVGARVKFVATAAARMFYDGFPPPGAQGEVTTVPLPGGRKSCFPGPRGGMVYVKWDSGRVEGVFAKDLQFEGPSKKQSTLFGARRRKR